VVVKFTGPAEPEAAVTAGQTLVRPIDPVDEVEEVDLEAFEDPREERVVAVRIGLVGLDDAGEYGSQSRREIVAVHDVLPANMPPNLRCARRGDPRQEPAEVALEAFHESSVATLECRGKI
jgi:hypothetical protein